MYAIHGYFIGAEQWSHEIHVLQTIEGGFAQGANEMIVVLPDAKTIYNGSFYSISVAAGDFEDFIAHDVVAYVDAHYRTIQARTSRGLVGHSMGGYGATHIGLKHADVLNVPMSVSALRSPSFLGRGQRRRMRARQALAPSHTLHGKGFVWRRVGPIAWQGGLYVGDHETASAKHRHFQRPLFR